MGTLTTVGEKIVNGGLHNSVHVYKIKSWNVMEFCIQRVLIYKNLVLEDWFIFVIF